MAIFANDYYNVLNVDLLFRMKAVMNINGTFLLYHVKRIRPLLKLTLTLNCSL